MLYRPRKPMMEEDLTPEEQEYLNSIPKQNHLGILAMFFGGLGFAFGSFYISIPIAAFLYSIITFRTFDRRKHDNPWPFFVGITLSMIGIILYLVQYTPTLS
ncbi:cell division protein FtsK [Pontibacillus sp. HN14]|nr:cell division protein FtsK [Pontibacillus sp. HN14]